MARRWPLAAQRVGDHRRCEVCGGCLRGGGGCPHPGGQLTVSPDGVVVLEGRPRQPVEVT